MKPLASWLCNNYGFVQTFSHRERELVAAVDDRPPRSVELLALAKVAHHAEVAPPTQVVRVHEL